MKDLNNDVRMAVTTGKVSLGHKEVVRSIANNSAKMVVVAEKGRKDMKEDILHVCKVAEVKAVSFDGNSLELGAICGKPYSVNSLAVIEAGKSEILNE